MAAAIKTIGFDQSAILNRVVATVTALIAVAIFKNALIVPIRATTNLLANIVDITIATVLTPPR